MGAEERTGDHLGRRHFAFRAVSAMLSRPVLPWVRR